MYEKHSSSSLPEIINDNDFIVCCSMLEGLSISTRPKVSLRKRLGEDIVDNASRAEMSQILKKKVIGISDKQTSKCSTVNMR